jgi:hypothetical protein
MQAGAPFAHELDFSTGLPTGAVVYSVLGNDGLPLAGYDSLAVTPPQGALSIVLTVPGSANTCTMPLFETRTIVWSYSTTNGVVSDRTRYRIEKNIPFPVTEEGVRYKLGVQPHELEDNAINLLLAYARLSERFDLAPYTNAGDYRTLIVMDAIEAQAALDALPSLQLAVAKSEDSGTNKYQRFSAIDWDMLAASLGATVDGLAELAGDDNVFGGRIIFMTAGPTTDPVTNAAYRA